MWFVITDDNSDSSYSLYKIILDLFSVFFGLVEAVNSQPGSGAPPRSPRPPTKLQEKKTGVLPVPKKKKKKKKKKEKRADWLIVYEGRVAC